MMSPEERFEKIENLFHVTAEQQAKHTDQIEKQNEAVRALIVVARTCLDSIKELRETQRESLKELREAQAATDEKLNILISTVDRIIGRANGKH